MIADWFGVSINAGTLVDTTAWTLLHFCWQAAAGALLYLALLLGGSLRMAHREGPGVHPVRLPG